MNKKETMEQLEEAAEIVSTHLGDENLEWGIKPKRYSNKSGEIILTVKVEYEEDSE